MTFFVRNAHGIFTDAKNREKYAQKMRRNFVKIVHTLIGVHAIIINVKTPQYII